MNYIEVELPWNPTIKEIAEVCNKMGLDGKELVGLQEQLRTRTYCLWFRSIVELVETPKDRG